MEGVLSADDVDQLGPRPCGNWSWLLITVAIVNRHRVIENGPGARFVAGIGAPEQRDLGRDRHSCPGHALSQQLASGCEIDPYGLQVGREKPAKLGFSDRPGQAGPATVDSRVQHRARGRVLVVARLVPGDELTAAHKRLGDAAVETLPRVEPLSLGPRRPG